MAKQKVIYCDMAATTPVHEAVIKEISTQLKNNFGNAGSIHNLGLGAQKTLESSRKTIADFLKARSQEIIFTGSGTEANNLAILGLYRNLLSNGHRPGDLHIITTNIEHSSVLKVYQYLKSEGVEVEYLPVEKTGLLNPKLLREKLRANTVLVSIGLANSEIGVIQPVHDIAKEIRHARKSSTIKINQIFTLPYFHLDASQAPLWLSLDTQTLGADLVVIDGQKIYGPKGVGALFVREGIKLSPIQFGGGQERGLRPGTENVPLIVGFAKAISLINNSDKEINKVKSLRDYFIKKLQTKISEIIINGDMESRLPNNVNFSLPGSDAEYLLLQLAEYGIYCSAKSACLSDEVGSYVVAAVNDNKEAARSSLRFSFDKNITKKDLDYIIEVLSKRIIRGGLI
ncbi:MAG: cysteine desulfurase family protein [Minisyncoccia bacterium]